MFYQVLQKVKSKKEKTAKVSTVFPDTELEGKITVTKGGGKRRPTACPSRISISRIKKHWQERQNKKPRRGEKIMALTTINLTAGMRANLFSLQKTSRDTQITQGRLATGLKVNTALDNPINFFTAQEHRLRASDLAGRKDGMSEAIQTVKAANVGVEGISNLIAQAKSLAQSAMSASSTSEATTFASQYGTVMAQINQMAADSGYKGVNLLQAGSLTVEFAPTAGDSSLSLTGFGGTTTDFNITGLTAELTSGAAGNGGNWADDSAISTAAILISIDNLETATGNLRTESKKLSNNLSIITAREDFTSQMINTLSDGAAKLTEADMNEESANLLMLQTRQALGTTSLSLASQAAQSVLRLF
jgi:flagellin-like hook-associated protein FlgL